MNNILVLIAFSLLLAVITLRFVGAKIEAEEMLREEWMKE